MFWSRYRYGEIVTDVAASIIRLDSIPEWGKIDFTDWPAELRPDARRSGFDCMKTRTFHWRLVLATFLSLVLGLGGMLHLVSARAANFRSALEEENGPGEQAKTEAHAIRGIQGFSDSRRTRESSRHTAVLRREAVRDNSGSGLYSQLSRRVHRGKLYASGILPLLH